MPGITIFQEAVSSYSTGGGSGGNLPCSFTSDNIQGNIGLAFILADSGTMTDVDDSNLNLWYQLPGFTTEVGFIAVWTCPILFSGANTITAHGLTESATGGPNLVIIEITPPPCPLGMVGIQCFQPNLQGDYFDPQLEFSSTYLTTQGAFYHTLIAALKCGTTSSSGTVRTWSMTPNPNFIDFDIIIQYTEPTGTATGTVGFCTVPYPNMGNSVEFNYSPSTPVINPGETWLVGVLFSTVS